MKKLEKKKLKNCLLGWSVGPEASNKLKLVINSPKMMYDEVHRNNRTSPT